MSKEIITSSPPGSKQPDSKATTSQELLTRRAGFVEFWTRYKRKDKKFLAHKKWMSLSQEDVDMIFSTLDEYLKSTTDIRFRPMAITYLNQRRWEDFEPAAPVAKAPSWVERADYD